MEVPDAATRASRGARTFARANNVTATFDEFDSMPSLSTSALEKARKAYSRVLQAMQEPGTARQIAQVLGTSETTISRTKGHLEDSLTLLYHLGFKVVPADCQNVPPDYLQALQVMAREHMRSAKQPLEWDE